MAKREPKQSPTTRLGNTTDFVRAVKPYLAKNEWTQKDLAEASGMTEAMISRMFRNDNGRGDTFNLTERMVYKIAAGLRIGRQGYWSLMEIAFPELFEALGQGDNPNRLNITLIDKGKPTL